jgi:two-component system sensor histidine kinase KdpD
VLIEQLLVNLVENAAKYSPSESAIEVSARQTDHSIELEVADRGRGFAAGDERRVYDLFYRGSSVNPDRRGTGIGLAICRAIAEVHGGRIKAANRPGGGAVVTVSLPHAESPPPVHLQLVEHQPA